MALAHLRDRGLGAARALRQPVASALPLLAALWFGATRDFGAFLFSLPILALLLVVAVASASRTARRPPPARVATAWALICLAPVAYAFAYRPAQEIRFLLWAPAHMAQLAQARRHDGIVLGWDGWGMAGQDTSSYLVVDTQDRLASADRAAAWTRAIGQTCGIWETQRVWPQFYIVTTFTNCPYDGVAAP